MEKKDFAPLARHLDHLAARWADESEYEDFAEYVASVEKTVRALAPTATDVRLTKRFKLTFIIEGITHEIKVTSRAVTYKTYSPA